MPKRDRPRVHGRDHEHGGADPTRIHYEDVSAVTTGKFSKIKFGDNLDVTESPTGVILVDATSGGGGSGIQFETYPQAGEWLYVETDGAATSPSGYGMEFFDLSGNGINFGTSSGGPILIEASGGGDIRIQQASSGAAIWLLGHIILSSSAIDTALPTSDPGVSGRLWNSGGVVSVSP